MERSDHQIEAELARAVGGVKAMRSSLSTKAVDNKMGALVTQCAQILFTTFVLLGFRKGGAVKAFDFQKFP